MPEPRSRGNLSWALLIVVGMLIGAAAGYVGGQPPAKSVSDSEILVVGAVTDRAADDAVLTRNQYVNQRMPTYAVIAVSDVTTERAAATLGVTPDTLAGSIKATVIPESTVLALSVTGATPAEAQRRSAAVANALQAVIVQTENLPGQPERVRLSMVSEPRLPVARADQSLYAAAFGAVAGLLVGAVGGFLLRRRESAHSRTVAPDDPGTDVPDHPRQPLPMLSKDAVAPGAVEHPVTAPRPDLGPAPQLRVPTVPTAELELLTAGVSTPGRVGVSDDGDPS